MPTEADVFMVKYIEVTGTDPAKVVATCAKLGIKASEAGAETAVATIDAEAESPPKKRGPGRPRKEETTEEAPPKRKRGRPRKQKDDEDTADDAPPRKRGRPPTRAADDVPKRKRGRPRKQKEEPEEAPSKRRSAEPPDDSDDGNDAPKYADIVKHLKREDPSRLAYIVEELYLEFGWDKPRDMAQVLISVRKDTKLEETDFWAVLERICPAGEEDDWLDLLEDKIKPHLEEAIGAAEEED